MNLDGDSAVANIPLGGPANKERQETLVAELRRNHFSSSSNNLDVNVPNNDGPGSSRVLKRPVLGRGLSIGKLKLGGVISSSRPLMRTNFGNNYYTSNTAPPRILRRSSSASQLQEAAAAVASLRDDGGSFHSKDDLFITSHSKSMLFDKSFDDDGSDEDMKLLLQEPLAKVNNGRKSKLLKHEHQKARNSASSNQMQKFTERMQGSFQTLFSTSISNLFSNQLEKGIPDEIQIEVPPPIITIPSLTEATENPIESTVPSGGGGASSCSSNMDGSGNSHTRKARTIAIALRRRQERREKKKSTDGSSQEQPAAPSSSTRLRRALHRSASEHLKKDKRTPDEHPKQSTTGKEHRASISKRRDRRSSESSKDINQSGGISSSRTRRRERQMSEGSDVFDPAVHSSVLKTRNRDIHSSDHTESTEKEKRISTSSKNKTTRARSGSVTIDTSEKESSKNKTTRARCSSVTIDTAEKEYGKSPSRYRRKSALDLFSPKSPRAHLGGSNGSKDSRTRIQSQLEDLPNLCSFDTKTSNLGKDGSLSLQMHSNHGSLLQPVPEIKDDDEGNRLTEVLTLDREETKDAPVLCPHDRWDPGSKTRIGNHQSEDTMEVPPVLSTHESDQLRDDAVAKFLPVINQLHKVLSVSTSILGTDMQVKSGYKRRRNKSVAAAKSAAGHEDEAVDEPEPSSNIATNAENKESRGRSNKNDKAERQRAGRSPKRDSRGYTVVARPGVNRNISGISADTDPAASGFDLQCYEGRSDPLSLPGVPTTMMRERSLSAIFDDSGEPANTTTFDGGEERMHSRTEEIADSVEATDAVCRDRWGDSIDCLVAGGNKSAQKSAGDSSISPERRNEELDFMCEMDGDESIVSIEVVDQKVYDEEDSFMEGPLREIIIVEALQVPNLTAEAKTRDDFQASTTQGLPLPDQLLQGSTDSIKIIDDLQGSTEIIKIIDDLHPGSFTGDSNIIDDMQESSCEVSCEDINIKIIDDLHVIKVIDDLVDEAFAESAGKEDAIEEHAIDEDDSINSLEENLLGGNVEARTKMLERQARAAEEALAVFTARKGRSKSAGRRRKSRGSSRRQSGLVRKRSTSRRGMDRDRSNSGELGDSARHHSSREMGDSSRQRSRREQGSRHNHRQEPGDTQNYANSSKRDNRTREKEKAGKTQSKKEHSKRAKEVHDTYNDKKMSSSRDRKRESVKKELRRRATVSHPEDGDDPVGSKQDKQKKHRSTIVGTNSRPTLVQSKCTKIHGEKSGDSKESKQRSNSLTRAQAGHGRRSGKSMAKAKSERHLSIALNREESDAVCRELRKEKKDTSKRGRSRSSKDPMSESSRSVNHEGERTMKNGDTTVVDGVTAVHLASVQYAVCKEKKSLDSRGRSRSRRRTLIRSEK